MTPLILGSALLLFAVARLVWQRRESRLRTLDRLDDLGRSDVSAEDPGLESRTRLMRARTPWIARAAIAVVVGIALVPVLDDSLAVASAVLVGTLVGLGLEAQRRRQAYLIEVRLADAIDLAIAGLQAGTSMHAALQTAAEESRGVLQHEMLIAAARLRLGERPEQVFDELYRALPIPSVRLLGQTLAAQWEAGGSVAPSLGSVASSIRQRVELMRRIQSQAAEVRFSVLAVLAATYGIGFLSWSNAPEEVESFLTSSVGGSLLALAVILQAAGLVWIQALSRVEVR
ncbi:MAG: type II secretion system F family protein [Planctomycetota bacterium]